LPFLFFFHFRLAKNEKKIFNTEMGGMLAEKESNKNKKTQKRRSIEGEKNL
jgi:hypothetical protein